MRSREARAIYTTIACASISGATFALRQLALYQLYSQHALNLVLNLLVITILQSYQRRLCICLPQKRVYKVFTELLNIEYRVYFVGFRQFKLKRVAYLLKNLKQTFYLVSQLTTKLISLLVLCSNLNLISYYEIDLLIILIYLSYILLL